MYLCQCTPVNTHLHCISSRLHNLYEEWISFSLRFLVQVKRASRDSLLNQAFIVWGYSFAWLPTFHGYRALNEKVKGLSWFLGRFHARYVGFLAHWIHILCRRGINLCTLDFYLVAVLTRVERIIWRYELLFVWRQTPVCTVQSHIKKHFEISCWAPVASSGFIFSEQYKVE